MDSKIAVYDTHQKAVSAIKALKESGIPLENISLLGKAEILEDNIHVKTIETVKETPAFIGIGAGAILGLLSGIGVLTIPGFGFLYGAGALIGLIGGLDLGIIGGGLVSLLAFIGFKEDIVIRMDEHLKEGKFIVITKGSLEEVEKAEHVLHTEGTHLEILNGN